MNKYISTFVFALCLSACASTHQYIGRRSITDTPTEGKATIYIARPSILGSAIHTKITAQGQLIGKLGPKGYLSWEVDPQSNYCIVASTENQDSICLNLEANKKYYLKSVMKMGFLVGRCHLKEISESEYLSLSKKLKQ